MKFQAHGGQVTDWQKYIITLDNIYYYYTQQNRGKYFLKNLSSANRVNLKKAAYFSFFLIDMTKCHEEDSLWRYSKEGKKLNKV